MNAWSTYEDLIGKLPLKVEIDSNDAVCFKCSNGILYKIGHHQDCCESVRIEEIIGDVSIFEGRVISNITTDSKDLGSQRDEVTTQTTFVITSGEDSVTIIWMGSSNGYYSTSVDFDSEPWPIDEYRDHKIDQIIIKD